MNEPKQCKSNDGLRKLQCQGCPRHTGPHWAYDPKGCLIQWRNKKEKDPKWKHIGCSWTPPGHMNYISPEKMIKYCYLDIWAKEQRKKKHDKLDRQVGKKSV